MLAGIRRGPSLSFRPRPAGRIPQASGAAGGDRARARNSAEPRLLPVDTAGGIQGLYRAAFGGGAYFGAERAAFHAGGGGKADRPRPRKRARNQPHPPSAYGRVADLQDRPLPRQGNRAESLGAALCQLDLRAAMGKPQRRSRADNGGGGGGSRHARRLLRPFRRAARHGAEPYPATAHDADDGSAGHAG